MVDTMISVLHIRKQDKRIWSIKELPEHVMIIPVLGQVIGPDFMEQLTIDLGFER